MDVSPSSGERPSWTAKWLVQLPSVIASCWRGIPASTCSHTLQSWRQLNTLSPYFFIQYVVLHSWPTRPGAFQTSLQYVITYCQLLNDTFRWIASNVDVVFSINLESVINCMLDWNIFGIGSLVSLTTLHQLTSEHLNTSLLVSVGRDHLIRGGAAGSADPHIRQRIHLVESILWIRSTMSFKGPLWSLLANKQKLCLHFSPSGLTHTLSAFSSI